MKLRTDGRTNNQLRAVKTVWNSFGYADSSVLFELGRTKVVASLTLCDTVPRFLRGKGTGWLTAEYAMLPCSTRQRMTREATGLKRSGRSVEISRLIGRTLRSMTNLSALGEKTIQVDCDILQADGSTRVASISAASLALMKAQELWLEQGRIKTRFFDEEVFALSVGLGQEGALLDVTYEEDSQVQADFNFVMTRSGKLIEIQGTAEKFAMDWHQFDDMKVLAIEGLEQLKKQVDSPITVSNKICKDKQLTL